MSPGAHVYRFNSRQEVINMQIRATQISGLTNYAKHCFLALEELIDSPWRGYICLHDIIPHLCPRGSNACKYAIRFLVCHRLVVYHLSENKCNCSIIATQNMA